MSVINGKNLLMAAPIKGMATRKMAVHGVSYGLSEAGYDIRIKQSVEFSKRLYPSGEKWEARVDGLLQDDEKFALASTIEEFNMPVHLVGVVHDKSTWARQGLSVFNTVIEPGWKGFLTLELVYHGSRSLLIPAGAGIAQVLFSQVSNPATYGDGKYQNAADRPQEAIMLDKYEVPIK